MKKIIIPLPNHDSDPSEVAIPWKILKGNGHQVDFATPNGQMAICDPVMVTGKTLGLLKYNMMADKNALSAYGEMLLDSSFQNPKKWSQIDEGQYHLLHLPGGHAKGVIPYLESQELQDLTALFFKKNKPVSAVCHGVVLAARSKIDNKSVLEGRNSTCLPAWMECLAWNLTRLWLGDYYKTYPDISVEKEVRSALGEKGKFHRGPFSLNRDSLTHYRRGFVVKDRNFLSARWPGDVHALSLAMLELLED